MKRKQKKKAEQIKRELKQIFERPSPKGHWTGEQYIAYNLWEVLVYDECIASKFLEDPTIKGWKKARFWLRDEHRFYCLKNFNPKSQREADRLAKKDPMWTFLVPLEDVERRLEMLEENGE